MSLSIFSHGPLQEESTFFLERKNQRTFAHKNSLLLR